MKLSFPATLLLSVASVSAQQSSVQVPNSSADEVQGYSLEANSFIDALLKLSAQFQFPLGVEWVKSADMLKPVRFSQTHTTVKDIIQSVVSMHAGYDWRTEDGVIHVFQRDLVKDSRNPLNITLDSWPCRREMIAREVEFYLDMGVRAVVAPKIESGGWGASFGSNPAEPKFQFNCTDVSVRYVLNRIIKVSTQNIWIATFPKIMGLTRAGFFDEVPMFNLPYVPGQDQPFWIMLRWGDLPLENMVR
jgi:hypothetical protein